MLSCVTFMMIFMTMIDSPNHTELVSKVKITTGNLACYKLVYYYAINTIHIIMINHDGS